MKNIFIIALVAAVVLCVIHQADAQRDPNCNANNNNNGGGRNGRNNNNNGGRNGQGGNGPRRNNNNNNNNQGGRRSFNNDGTAEQSGFGLGNHGPDGDN